MSNDVSVQAGSTTYGEANAHQFDRQGRAIVNRPCCLVCGQDLPPGDPLAFCRLERQVSPHGTVYAVRYQNSTIAVTDRWEDGLELARGVDRAILAALGSEAGDGE